MSNILSQFDSLTASTKETKPIAERAKLNYSDDGVCPYCSKAMARTFAAGQPIHICRADRYVAPMRNEVLAKVEAELASNAGVPDFGFSE